MSVELILVLVANVLVVIDILNKRAANLTQIALLIIILVLALMVR